MNNNEDDLNNEESLSIRKNVRNSSNILPEHSNKDLLVNSYKPELLPTTVLIPKTTTDIVTNNVLSNDITLPQSTNIDNIDSSTGDGISSNTGDDLVLLETPSGIEINNIYNDPNINENSTGSTSNIISGNSMDTIKLENNNLSGSNINEICNNVTSRESLNIGNSKNKPRHSFIQPEYKPSKSLTFTLNNGVNLKRSSIYESKSKVKAIPIRNANPSSTKDNTNDDVISINSGSSSLNASMSKSFLYGFYNMYQRDPKKAQDRVLQKEYWMKDENARECFICGKTFNTFRRKHHCRMCGQIFCRNCITPITGEKVGYNGEIKVCLTCCRHIDTYEDSSEEVEENEEETSELKSEEVPSSYESTPEISFENTKNLSGTNRHNFDYDDIQSILTTGEDSKLFISTPPPPPKMIIPATRQGESLEIFSDKGYTNTSTMIQNNTFDNRLTFNARHSNHKDRYTIRDVDILPDQYESKLNLYQHKMKKKNTGSSLKNSFLNYVSSSRSPQDKNQYQNSNASDIFKQVGKKQYKFEFNYDLDHEAVKFNPSRNNIHGKSPLQKKLSTLRRTKESEQYNSDFSSEDEGSMSIYSSLVDPTHNNNPIRSVRKSTKSSQRAAASLRRIRFRRKSKSKAFNLSNASSIYKGMDMIVQSTPNLISVIDDDEYDSHNYREDNSPPSPSIPFSNNIHMKQKDTSSPYSTKHSTGTISETIYQHSKGELNEVSKQHLKSLLSQVMKDQSLGNNIKWINIMEIFLKQLQLVEINAKEANSLDYRQNYIKIKRIAGDVVESSEYINGIVFGKTLPSKRMPRYLSNPRILLIMFPLEYTKNENQLLTLETVLAQEREYLNKLISRITSLNADIIFVGANVSGYALDLLDKSGVIAQFNMKPQVIERIAKLTEADIAVSIDKLTSNIKMGECDSFEVKTFIYGNISKTYTFLRGCIPSLGGTILLRGEDDNVLQKLKQITEFMVYVYFSLRLENSLFKDNFIQPSLEYYKARNDNEVNSNLEGYFSEFLNAYNGRILSISPTVEFPLPFLLRRGRELEETLSKKKQESLSLVDESGINNLKWILPDDIESKLTKADLSYLIKFVHDKEIENLELEFLRRSRQWELSYSQSHNMLSTGSHQSITVLYSMVSTKFSTPCIGPQILNIDYFWDNDISIGQYIENIIATSMYPCQQGCNGLLLDHYRSYVHGSGKVDVLIEKLQSKLPKLNDIILTWSYCKKCGTSTPILQMGQRTWSYSFGKFLEVMFWSKQDAVEQVSKCGHDFTKDHVKYFGYNELVVRMEYSDLEVFELITPPRKIVWKCYKNIKLKVELFYYILDKINIFYGSIKERLDSIKLDGIPDDLYLKAQSSVMECTTLMENEKTYILNLTEDLYKSLSGDVHLPLNRVIRILSENSENWHLKFDNFAMQYMPSETDISQITANQLKKLFNPNMEHLPKSSIEDSHNDNTNLIEEPHDAVLDSQIKNSKEKIDSNLAENYINDSYSISNGKTIPNLKPKIDLGAISINIPDMSLDKQAASPSPSDPIVTSKTVRSSISDLDKPNLRRLSLISDEELTKYYERGHYVDTKVGKLASFFDRMHIDSLSKEFELQRELERLSLNKAKYQSQRLNNATPIVDIYKDVKDAVDEPLHDKESPYTTDKKNKNSTNISYQNNLNTNLEHELENSIHMWGEKMRNLNNSNKNEDLNKTNALKDSNPEFHQRLDDRTVDEKHEISTNLDDTVDSKLNNPIDKEPEQSSTKNGNVSIPHQGASQRERTSLLKTLSNFWADRSASSWKPLQYPTSTTEHIFPDCDVIIREDEPSSLIAFCLNIDDYAQKMQTLKKCDEEDILGNMIKNNAISKSDIFTDDEKEGNDSKVDKLQQSEILENSSQNKDHPKVLPIDNSELLEKVMLKKKAVHLRYQFQDQDTVMSCKIFFAEHFEAFRETCCDHDKFIQSLSRCIKWDSNGGKSGSGFLKTLDDRFVIKELSHNELDAFIKFAPSYFEYMSQATFHDLPTSLAKIFGFYQIQVKNSSNSTNYKMDLIIMENLFYERKTTRIFDLKGSMRNRHVEQTGKENEVLLDENMVEYIYESPIHVGEYDKKLLRASLWNDTLFLAKMNVMDYSLVIGIDNESHTITAGIIDFIRTFTWDKKLESWVKEKGLVGGGASSTKTPTVVTPRQYKNRFREAMERYILMVPDPWYQEMT